MRESEKNNSVRLVRPKNDEVRELERWFKTEYLERKAKVTRYNYLRIRCDETLYDLENEAYKKEQRLRELCGKEPLPEIKIGGVF